jgi:hypothetical protein
MIDRRWFAFAIFALLFNVMACIKAIRNAQPATAAASAACASWLGLLLVSVCLTARRTR